MKKRRRKRMMKEGNGGESSSEVEAKVQDFLKQILQELCDGVALGNVKEAGFSSEASNVTAFLSAAEMDGERRGTKKDEEKEKDEAEQKMAVLYIVCVLLFFAASIVVLLVRHVRREKETKGIEAFYREYLLIANAAASPIQFFTKEGRPLPGTDLSSSYSRPRRGSLPAIITSSSQRPTRRSSYHGTSLSSSPRPIRRSSHHCLSLSNSRSSGHHPTTSTNSQSPISSSSHHHATSTNSQSPISSHHPTSLSNSQRYTQSSSHHPITSSCTQSPVPSTSFHVKLSAPSQTFKGPSFDTSTSRPGQLSTAPSTAPAAMYWSSESSGSDLDEDVVDVSGLRVNNPLLRTPQIPHSPGRSYGITCVSSTPEHTRQSDEDVVDVSGLRVNQPHLRTPQIPPTPGRSYGITCVSSTPEHVKQSASGVSVDISCLSIAQMPASTLNRPQTSSNRTISEVTCLPDTPVRLDDSTDGVSVDFCGLREAQLPYGTPRKPDTPINYAGREVACSPATPLQLNNAGPSLAPHTPANCTVLDVTYSPNSPVQLHNIELPTTPHTPTYYALPVATSPATPEQQHNRTITASSYVNKGQYGGGYNTTAALPNTKAEDFGKVPSTTSQLPSVKYDDGTTSGSTEAFKHCGTKDLVSEGGQTEYHSSIADVTRAPTHPLAEVSKSECILTELNVGNSATCSIAENLTLPQNATNEVTKESEHIDVTSITPDLVPASNTRPSDTLTTTTTTTTTNTTGPGATPKRRFSGRPTSL
ncbi:uncharacterized protein LOC126997087 isoform X2 [Eriocheir sinensis]|uniref:uncharacterized protein LOC126997087 isoform X2 n=1 Tax=Eriocheir sinensis TaxID=95602 RepID=UPI0021C8312D|nr:uncharacterized protein LOC126997087 isoform X2 [Eriocheir sinensis]